MVEGRRGAGARRANLPSPFQIFSPAMRGNTGIVVSNVFGSVTSFVAFLTVNLATLENDFDPGANAAVGELAVLPDGGILVGDGSLPWVTRYAPIWSVFLPRAHWIPPSSQTQIRSRLL